MCFEARRISQELELKQHALALLKERMAGSESAQLAEAVAMLEAELAGEEEAARSAKEAKESLVTTAKVSRVLQGCIRVVRCSSQHCHGSVECWWQALGGYRLTFKVFWLMLTQNREPLRLALGSAASNLSNLRS